MPANVNPETGIAYGVVSARNVPHLYDEIFSRGRNERLWERDEDIRDTIVDLCKDMLSKDDIEEIIDHIQERANETEAGDSPDTDIISYTDEDGNQFRLGELGGAPLIWCIKTDTKVRVPACSICVPNAGDLDRPGDVYGPMVNCYGVPAAYLKETP
jgi:hypothetical protein